MPSTAIVQSGAGVGDRREAEPLDFAPAAARQHAREAVVAAVDDQPAGVRDRAHQMMELRLDRGEIGKDVGVVVLEVVQDRGARTVVDEFRALVAERGVVFVGLDHEERAVREARRDAEVECDAADQESRLRVRPGRVSRRASRVVVVLPCVPATASTHLSSSTFSASHCGPEI